MKILLTGSTGFIGSYVLAEALAAGHQVWSLRRSIHSKPVTSLQRSPQWITSSLQELQPDKIPAVDVVVHLAYAGVSPKLATWDDLIETNIISTLKLFRMGYEKGVRRFVVAGTCHEYGQSASRLNPIPANAPLEPISAYGASKAASYMLLRAFAIEKNLEFFYGRIFTAYGDGQFPGNFWPSLKSAALSGNDFEMTSGQQISNFISVSDVAFHLLQACVRSDILPGIPFVTNIGSDSTMTLESFAESQWSHFGAKGRLLLGKIPDRLDQISQYIPDLKGLTIDSCHEPP